MSERDDFIQGQKGSLVTFDDEGEAQIEGMNFKRSDGVACEEHAAEIVGDLGGEIEETTYKPEYQRRKQRAEQQIGNG